MLAGLFLVSTPAPAWSMHIPGDNGGDEELRSVGVLAGVGHGEETLLGVLELEVLVGELFAVDCDAPVR